MRYPENATAEPDALKILLGSSLPSDLTVQMKVLIFSINLQYALIVTVFALLEPSKSSHCCYVFPTGIPEQPVHPPICHACLGKSFSGRDFFLCASNRTNLTL